MKKGQQIRNVSDESAMGGVTVGAAYTLMRDADESYVRFIDDAGVPRMRPREGYELVQPDDDKVLTMLKEMAKKYEPSEDGTYERAKYHCVLDLLRAAYGLRVKITPPQVDFVPING